MNKLRYLKSALVGGASASALALAGPAAAKVFDVPGGDLSTVLGAYMQQSGLDIVYLDDVVRGHKSLGAKGDYTETAALTQILKGTGFAAQAMNSSTIGIVPAPKEPSRTARTMQVAAAAPAQSGVETVVVTAQKKSEDIQQVPIAVSAFSQKELTERQIAGGPDLVKEVPNLTFSKTNFSGYNLEIRGIGTQAISVTTDPAVAVAFNSIPFIRNHFFEQEFYDLSDAEVLRGPQGTLYGRNATAGVVNIESAKPTGDFEAMASVDMGNYGGQRYEGMLNIPIVGDQLDIRMAGEWTKREGYTDDTTLNESVDGRDLWSTRLSVGWKPNSDIQTEFVWEHFSEDDDRLRSGKQLCKTDPGPTTLDGYPAPPSQGSALGLTAANFSQGCEDTSLYSPQAFEVPNGFSLPFVSGAAFLGFINTNIDPYASTTQSTNLRDIQSAILPHYIAKNDTLEFNADWNITPELTLTSQTGYNRDFLWSTEDYNRFDTSPGVFKPGVDNGFVSPTGVVCDPQLGCSNRLVVEDLSDEHAWQFSQEFRLASNFSGPLNFSAGGNFLHYETEENYYVFSNTFTMISYDNICYTPSGAFIGYPLSLYSTLQCLGNREQYTPPANGGGVPTESPQYIDPNPLSSLNNQGHNYFLSQNPYMLNSYAMFGEAYYNLFDDLKLTAGARWTDDQKQFVEIPSQLLTKGYGYPSIGTLDQGWNQWTGRFVADWTPQLDFTDQTLIYGSVAHGYKAGGANPPGPVLLNADTLTEDGKSINDNFPDHPLTFKPEFIQSFELGTKNTALDGALTVNGDIFYYNYTGYQISEIVDRTAINLNFNAHVEGAELETNWEPIPGLKFGFAGGFEETAVAGGSQAIDLMDRTAGMPGWTVMKPSVGQSSNCIFPTYVAAALIQAFPFNGEGNEGSAACGAAYFAGLDPVTDLPYTANPHVEGAIDGVLPPGYIGYNPETAPNNGEGFDKNLGGNQLPNAPHFTTSLTAEYTMPVSADWAATFHTDLYWQSQQWARVFEDPIDKIHGYSNVNLSLILTSASGWEAMAYVKNVFDVTAITGTFLNSDDSGLTTNVFLTDPRLIGIRLTKHFGADEGPSDSIFGGIPDLFADKDNGKPPIWVQLGGDYSFLSDGQQPYDPAFFSKIPGTLFSPLSLQHPPTAAFDYDGKISYQPDGSDWIVSVGIRYGRSASDRHIHQSLPPTPFTTLGNPFLAFENKFEDTTTAESESQMILDFMAGQDVGLGMFGLDGSSTLSSGVRIAQFESDSSVAIDTDPDYQGVLGNPKYHDVFNGTSHAKRAFHGIGPAVSWDASTPVFGNTQNGELTLDWGANGAVLFGRQQMNETHQTSKCHVSGPGGSIGACPVVYTHAGGIARSRQITVPNLGGFGGVSMVYNNAKVSFGYRADEFFNAMDGGYQSSKSYSRGFFGPYANISIGIGG